jgi:sensor histidine kinase regulating citrate/malate metabolism
MKQHIDEPFYKNLKGFEQKNYNLSIVRRAVVSTLGGDIEIIDTEDNHTHFNIDIPV